MAKILTSKRTTKGVFWRGFTAGDQFRRPFAEWAYLTPRYPSGLTASDLNEADSRIQRETVLFWFLLNLKPFDLSSGRWFAFDTPGRGFGQAAFAPSPLKAIDVVNDQFGDVLDASFLQEVVSALPGNWMWDEVTHSTEPGAIRHSADARQETLLHLDLLKAAIDRLATNHGGMGHNLAPADELLTTQERLATLEAVARTRAGVTAGDAAGLETARTAWLSIAPIAEKLGHWLLARTDDFGTEFSKGAGKSLGEKLPVYTLRMLAAAGVWHEIKIVAEHLLHLSL